VSLFCVVMLAAVSWWGVVSPAADGPGVRACQVAGVLDSPEWGTVVRNRNAHELADLRAASQRGAGPSPDPRAASDEGRAAGSSTSVGVAPPPSPLIDWRPSVERWRPLVAAYFSPGEVEHALAIIRCESLGDPEALNPSSGTAGLFQHRPAYWPARSSASGWAGHSPYEPEANVAVAAWLVHHGGGWVHWSGRPWGVDSCEEYACAQGVC